VCVVQTKSKRGHQNINILYYIIFRDFIINVSNSPQSEWGSKLIYQTNIDYYIICTLTGFILRFVINVCYKNTFCFLYLKPNTQKIYLSKSKHASIIIDYNNNIKTIYTTGFK